jgi:hypothetical protein
MSATTRYVAQKAIARLEWIERHVTARPDDRATRERLADEVDDLMTELLRLAAAHMPQKRKPKTTRGGEGAHRPKTRAASSVVRTSPIPESHPAHNPLDIQSSR